MANLFWLDDDAWAAIEPHLPKNQPGARRVDDRRIISGIIHVLKSGCRWRDCPPDYGPPTTVYNRFNRWSRRDHWRRILKALAAGQWITTAVAMDGSYVKAHRCAHGGKGGEGAQAIGLSRGGQTTKIHALSDTLGRPVVLKVTAGTVSDITMAEDLLAEVDTCRHILADKGYDSDTLRTVIRNKGATPVIPGRRCRKRKISFDKRRYKFRWMVEAVFCRLKDFRRVATRYDKLARNYASSLALATIVAYWT
ncbi:MAG: IS5 family transposase [Defluviicoccus sp.]|nr:MAG: IS5 family transposase [Defluviicoccus sp.]